MAPFPSFSAPKQTIRIPTFQSPTAKTDSQAPQTRDEARAIRLRSGNDQWQSLNAFAAAEAPASLTSLLSNRVQPTPALSRPAQDRAAPPAAEEPSKAAALERRRSRASAAAATAGEPDSPPRQTPSASSRLAAKADAPPARKARRSSARGVAAAAAQEEEDTEDGAPATKAKKEEVEEDQPVKRPSLAGKRDSTDAGTSRPRRATYGAAPAEEEQPVEEAPPAPAATSSSSRRVPRASAAVAPKKKVSLSPYAPEVEPDDDAAPSAPLSPPHDPLPSPPSSPTEPVAGPSRSRTSTSAAAAVRAKKRPSPTLERDEETPSEEEEEQVEMALLGRKRRASVAAAVAKGKGKGKAEGKKVDVKGKGKARAVMPEEEEEDEQPAAPPRKKARAKATAKQADIGPPVAGPSNPRRRLSTPPAHFDSDAASPASSSPELSATTKRKKKAARPSNGDGDGDGRGKGKQVRILTERVKGNKGRLNVFDVVAGGARKLLDRLGDDASDPRTAKALKQFSRTFRSSLVHRSSLLTSLHASHARVSTAKTRAKKLRLELLDAQRARAAVGARTVKAEAEWAEERREVETVSTLHGFLADLEKAAADHWRRR
ncbi:hypothetical protein JCM6882_001065 [Rhodosporidiobolus microsporus]